MYALRGAAITGQVRKTRKIFKESGKAVDFCKNRKSERSSALSKDLEGLMSERLTLVALQCQGHKSETACPKAGDSHKL